ncbi:MAG: TolC family protein [Chlorobiaceae bacterium]|nr:TolC family protein [Chlorobiaceae bacterium]
MRKILTGRRHPWAFRRIAIHLLLLVAVPAVEAHAAGTMTLTEAISAAMERNPSVGIERQKLRRLEAEYRTARAGLLPRLSASASYFRYDPDRLAMSAQTGGGLFEREAYGGVGLSQLLFDGKTNALRKAAGKASEAQNVQVAVSRNLAAYQASNVFIQILESRALLQAAGQAVQRARAFEEMTAAYFDAGKVTRLDLLHARSARLEAEASLSRARELGASGMALLAAVTGREAPDFTVVGQLPSGVSPAPPDSLTIEAAMSRNPDMQRLKRLSESAVFAADAAKGARYPAITAKAGWGYRDRDLGGGAGEWSAGVQLDLPLFDGGALGAGVARANAALAESREAERGERLAVQSQVRRELSAWRSAAADFRAAEQSVAAARESLDAAQALYRVGKATALDVLTAQQELAAAENRRAVALAGYASARAGVELLTGSVTGFTLNNQ